MQIVVIGIVKDYKGRVLIEKRLKQDGVPYSFPSGKVNAGESSEEAIRRETEEETAQQVSACRKIGERQNPYQNDIFLEYWECSLDAMSPIIPKKDEIEYAWYEEIENLTGFLGVDIFQPVKDHLKIR